MLEHLMKALLLMAPDDGAGSGGGASAPADDAGTPDEVGSGPDHGTPAENTGSEQSDVDWEQRYNDLRPEFDRRSQQISEYENFHNVLTGQAGPEAQAELLDALGIGAEDGEGYDDEDYDPDDPVNRLEQLEEHLAGQQEEAEALAMLEEENEFLVDGIGQLEQHAGREFTEQEIAILADLARSAPDEDGWPDLGMAYQQLQAFENSAQERWLESKRTSRIPGAGIAADEAVDLDDPDARVQHMAAILDAARDTAS